VSDSNVVVRPAGTAWARSWVAVATIAHLSSSRPSSRVSRRHAGERRHRVAVPVVLGLLPFLHRRWLRRRPDGRVSHELARMMTASSRCSSPGAHAARRRRGQRHVRRIGYPIRGRHHPGPWPTSTCTRCDALTFGAISVPPAIFGAGSADCSRRRMSSPR